MSSFSYAISYENMHLQLIRLKLPLLYVGPQMQFYSDIHLIYHTFNPSVNLNYFSPSSRLKCITVYINQDRFSCHSLFFPLRSSE